MPAQKFNFIGIDTDSSDLTIAADSARLMLNCRVGGSKDGNRNAIENVKGNSILATKFISTQSVTVTCPSGSFGEAVTVNYTYTSFISQADADAAALAKATAAANAALVCTLIAPDWQFVLASLRCKTDLGGNNTGEREAQKIDVAVGSSTEGQLQNGGEYFVYDTDLTACPLTIFSSAAISRPSTLSRDNCGSSSFGSTWTINVLAGAYTSTVSQSDADNQADADATAQDTQGNANVNGSCTATNIHPTGNSFVCTTGMLTFGVTRNGVPGSPNNGPVDVTWSLVHAIGGTTITSGTVTIAGLLLDSSTQNVGVSGLTLGETVILHLLTATPAAYTLTASTTQSVS